ncbi:2-oxo-4-hydroxy-4-carboxy-5-ureidoimidazoline decarboxylase [Streptomyces sp. NBC_00872]|uniref:2-oxo-4-hydroxy-4-carboxy-5-ureidoimidazoline decarboxylase n=1 Tax=Streptomyces sp. NBC_00872 TaxID=2903686 RepID=UPI003866F2FA
MRPSRHTAGPTAHRQAIDRPSRPTRPAQPTHRPRQPTSPFPRLSLRPASTPLPASAPRPVPAHGLRPRPPPPAAFEEPPLSSASHAGHPNGLHRFNTAAPLAAEAALLTCCGSRRWAQRLAAHRPYPDLDTLLAAADEASYDLSQADLTEALADESSSGPPHSAPAAARTALRAAHAAYESSFGHAFVISLDGHRPEEYLDEVLAGIHTRLSHEPDHERAVAADQLRRLARSRIALLVAPPREPGDTGRTADPTADPAADPAADPTPQLPQPGFTGRTGHPDHTVHASHTGHSGRGPSGAGQQGCPDSPSVAV